MRLHYIGLPAGVFVVATEVAERTVETQACYGRYSRTTTVMSSD
jgi:hypothetical protein